MAWCEGVEAPRLLIAPGEFAVPLPLLLLAVPSSVSRVQDPRVGVGVCGFYSKGVPKRMTDVRVWIEG
ncbi:hypothetical protein BHE74_00005862 [Ensete ventricosum]|nr:hypothetical protein BHE74_00005862 [Ensete ventricosum]